MSDIMCIAHRGASGEGHAPENTLAAFREAIKIGVDGIECDVHCTMDGHVVVIHDDTLNRTTNMRGVVEKMTLEEIKMADAGSWFGSSFAGERIPTLKEILELIEGESILVIEIKPKDITEKVVREIEESEAEDYVILQSFHPNVVKEVYELNPRIPRALLIGGRISAKWFSNILELVHEVIEVGAGVMNLSYKIIDPELIKESHRRGISVWGWTVDNELEMKSLKEMGVRGITSNYPGVLKSVIYSE
jgi:glycerophosphoryl diester phosphodiesterase